MVQGRRKEQTARDILPSQSSGEQPPNSPLLFFSPLSFFPYPFYYVHIPSGVWAD